MFEKIKCCLCDKEAVCHVTLVKDGQIIHKHYCSEHAQSVGLNEPKSFAFLDTGIVSVSPAASVIFKQCPACHYTFKDFESSGLLGCKECYNTFKELVHPILKKLQKDLVHRGKIPIQALDLTMLNRQISDFTTRMEMAIAEEHYEEAAQVRDQIKIVQEKIKDFGKANKEVKKK